MKKRTKLALLALTAVLSAGCKQSQKSSEIQVDTGRIYVSREHVVSGVITHTYEDTGAAFDQQELQNEVEGFITAYNEKHGQGSEGFVPVKLTSCTVDGQKGTLVIEYGTADNFIGFSNSQADDSHTVTRLMVDTVAGGLTAGAITDGTFVKPDGTAAAQEEILKQSELHLVAAEGSVTIQTEGTIVYMSEGTELSDAFTAKVPEGKSYIIFK